MADEENISRENVAHQEYGAIEMEGLRVGGEEIGSKGGNTRTLLLEGSWDDKINVYWERHARSNTWWSKILLIFSLIKEK